MNAKGLLLAFFLGAFLAAGVAYLVMRETGGSGSARSGPPAPDANLAADDRVEGAGVARKAPDTADDADALGPTLEGASDAAAYVAELERRSAALETEVAALREKLEHAQPKPRDPRAFRFGLPERAPSFDAADWLKLAGYMGKLTPLLRELRDLFEAGQGPTAKWLATVQRHNAPLATFAVQVSADLADGEAPNANVAYTHPAIFANLMRASLAVAELPLTGDQQIAIEALGDAWAREIQRAQASIAEDAPALLHTVLDVEAKQRFLDSVKTVLTPAQVEILFQPETEGRMHLDLLSPVLAYSPISVPVEATDRADMEQKLLESLLDTTGIDTEDLSRYAWVAREWVDAIPHATEPWIVTAVDFRCPHLDLVQARARAQVQATERILAMGGLTAEQASVLQAVHVVLHPFILQ